jgi:DNA polymerase I-like protein with 3'-5' exonuclease and polymerase domains
MNIINQGAGAEVAKLALHYFYPRLQQFNEDNNTDVLLVNFIHDSYILDCPDDPAVYEPLSVLLAEAMQEAWFEMSKLYRIKDLPMPVDVKVGYNWGDLEKGANVIHQYNLQGMEMYHELNK